MSKYVKDLQMRDYRKRLSAVEDMLIVNVIGIDAVQTNMLRLDLRKKGIELQVVKNSLAKKVLGEKGLDSAAGLLTGPSAVVWGGEGIVELAREISEWAKKIERLSIRGACVGGQALDATAVDQLSKLPSRVELLGRLVTQILSPGANLAALLLSPGGQLASQIKQKSEAEASEDAATPALA